MKFWFIDIILVLLLNSALVMGNTFTIIGLLPINSTSLKEASDLYGAISNLERHHLQDNITIGVQVYNNTKQEKVAMEILLEAFSHPNNITAIIGPGSEKSIYDVDQFLKTIPQKVLHLIYNPVIEAKEYLHNTAPPVTLLVDLLVDLMVEIKWNYIAIMRDSTAFSQLSSELFQEKARKKRICIGLVEVINHNEKTIFDKITSEGISGILVFGKEDTVRYVSRNLESEDLHFIFASNENLHTKNTKDELPDNSIQVLYSHFYNQATKDNHLEYMIDSVKMALKWFKIRSESQNRDLNQHEIINGTLDIYQKVHNEQFMVGDYRENLNLTLKKKIKESFCKHKCEKCQLLDTVQKTYTIKTGTAYIVILLPLHKNDINDHFMCSQSLRMMESVDLIEAARFAVKTSIRPDLGLIIVDSCVQTIVTTEQLIVINYTNVLGVIGGYYSLTTIPAAEVLTRLKIPQISYGAESHVFSDRGRFPYFQTTSISLEETAKAIIMLCKKMAWRAINIMYNNEAYGISGLSLLVKYADVYGICIINVIKVELGDKKFHTYLNQLRKTSKVKIVVNLMLHQSQTDWLSVLNEDLEKNEFLFIITYKLTDSQLKKSLKKHFNNHMIIEHKKPINKEFKKYYTNLGELDLKSNPWAKEFIEGNYKCRFEGSFNTLYQRKCEYKLQMDSVSDYHDLLIKAVYALINGTVAFDRSRSSDDDVAQKITRRIRKTMFNISGREKRLFDDDGNSQIQLFNLERVQKVDPVVTYLKVATYENGQWSSNQWDDLSYFTSTCESDDLCSVCPEETETLFIVFTSLDVILAVVIIGVVGFFICKQKGSMPNIN